MIESRKKIMIVEDEWIVANDLKVILGELNYDITSIASSGKETLNKLKKLKNDTKNKPELILMDISLEGDMDGIETASQVKSVYNIPVIYLTAYDDKEILKRAKISEPYGYIIKPYKVNELNATIEIALHKHKQDKKILEEDKKSKKILEGRKNSENIDEIDREIINLLHKDGRMKLIDISKAIAIKLDHNISNVSVKKRITKLLKNNVFKIQANLNLMNLEKKGYINSILLLETANYNISKELIEKFSECPRITFSNTVNSQYNLIFGVLSENISSLNAFMHSCSPKFHHGVLNSQLIICSETKIDSYIPFNPFFKSKQLKCGNNCHKCDFFKEHQCKGCLG